VRPVLANLEYHVVEHCNLTCKRCGHFSPIAPPAFSDPDAFARDIQQLATHFSTITRIRLLGGEPLLHPEPEAFVSAVRRVFPTTDIRIVTNGTRLKGMPERFWMECRRAGASLDWSLYPIMETARTEIERLCARQGVTLNVNRTTSFLAGINPRGDSDPQQAMDYCRSQFYCPFLGKSKLYVCALPPTAHYYNEKFGRSIPDDPGIDIYDPRLDGTTILKLLETPIETCRYCACQYESHRWERITLHRAEDYEVTRCDSSC
jgi:hypothetical protein